MRGTTLYSIYRLRLAHCRRVQYEKLLQLTTVFLQTEKAPPIDPRVVRHKYIYMRLLNNDSKEITDLLHALEVMCTWHGNIPDRQSWIPRLLGDLRTAWCQDGCERLLQVTETYIDRPKRGDLAVIKKATYEDILNLVLDSMDPMTGYTRGFETLRQHGILRRRPNSQAIRQLYVSGRTPL